MSATGGKTFRWKEHKHITMALLKAESDAVRCRTATLTAIQHTSGCNPSKLPDPASDPRDDLHDKRYENDLRVDLLMGTLVLKTLAPQFSAIARAFNPQATVTQGQCADLDTVKGAILLVSTKAGI